MGLVLESSVDIGLVPMYGNYFWTAEGRILYGADNWMTNKIQEFDPVGRTVRTIYEHPCASVWLKNYDISTDTCWLDINQMGQITEHIYHLGSLTLYPREDSEPRELPEDFLFTQYQDIEIIYHPQTHGYEFTRLDEPDSYHSGLLKPLVGEEEVSALFCHQDYLLVVTRTTYRHPGCATWDEGRVDYYRILPH